MVVRTLGAFVGRSFTEADESLWQAIQKHLSSLKSLGFEWEDAEQTQLKPISGKVKEKIERNDIFIGILTKRDPISKNYIALGNYCFAQTVNWLTSYWVIQESGYALGKGKKVVFLIEKGLTVPQGLNADYEYIEVDRDNPSSSFSRISGFINTEIGLKILPLEKIESVKEIELTSNIEQEKEESVETVAERERATDENYFKMVRDIRERDFAEAENIFKALLEEQPDGLKPFYETVYFSELYRAGQASALFDLKKLVKNNPKYDFAVSSLVSCYKYHDDYDKAIEELKAHIDMADSIGHKIRVSALLAALYAELKEYNLAISTISPFLSQGDDKSDDDNFLLYKTLGDIYKAQNELGLSCPLYDLALKYQPTDSDVRFRAAYDYGEMNNYKLSLYHYIHHQKTKETALVNNNLGVDYGNLKLHGKSIDKFSESSKQGYTLASSNLADNLIKCGFLEEAAKILKVAQKEEKYHINVDSHLKKLKQQIENESEIENNLLERTRELRVYIHSYARAIAVSNNGLDRISGLWHSDFKDIKEFRIEFKSPNILVGTHEYEYEVKATARGLDALYGNAASKPVQIRKKIITFNGTILNHGVKFAIKIEHHPMAASLLAALDSEINGFGILSDNNRNLVFISEKDKDFEVFTANKRE